MIINSQVRVGSDAAVLQLSGRFDAHEEPRVRNWVVSQRQDEISNLVVDLGAVSFIDSVALMLLMDESRQCRRHQGDLVLCNPAPAVRIILELTGLDREFQIWPTESEALSGFVSIKNI